jgi:hypothetical protein
MGRNTSWIAAALVTSAIFATLYVVVQQVERQGANDSPERLASQIVAQIETGPIEDIDTSSHVDISRSLVPFFVIYDDSGAPIEGTGYLDGKLATVPTGVLTAAKSSDDGNKVTWQPAPGLRFATVEVTSGDRVVLAGQSLGPSESRTATLGRLILLAWVGTMLIGAAVFVLGWVIRRRAGVTASS